MNNYCDAREKLKSLSAIFLLLLFFSAANATAKKKAFGVLDAMKFKTIKSSALSNDGDWVAFHLEPDWGDPEARIKYVGYDDEKKTVYKFDRGVYPRFSNNSKWAALKIRHRIIEIKNAKKGEKPKDTLALVNLESGETLKFENVKDYEFSEDSKWLVYVLDKKKKKSKRRVGDDIVLRHLATGSELPIDYVKEFAFDSLGNYFVYSVEEPSGKRNGLYYIKLQGLFNFPRAIIKERNSHFTELAWNNVKELLAFLRAKENEDKKADSCSLWIWDPRKKETREIVSASDSLDNSPPSGWRTPFVNELKWTQDGERLFFGFKPVNDTAETKPKVKFTDSNFYCVDTILKLTESDIWHWNDPRIKPNEKKMWKRLRDKIYLAVYHLKLNKVVQLADTSLPDVEFTNNPENAIGYDNKPYLKLITWDGWYKDLYKVDLLTGEKTLITKKISENASVSPSGRYIAFYRDKQWSSYDCQLDTVYEMTAMLKDEVPFYNVEYDEPSPPPSYGFAGWQEGEWALIYSQYDIWKFLPNGGGYLNLTAASGAVNKIVYRFKKLDKNKTFYKKRDQALLYGFDEEKKTRGVYRIDFSILGPELLLKENNLISILERAKDADRLLFTKQRYNVFPDLWVADTSFTETKRVSDANPQMKEFDWGETKLVKWTNSSGDTLRGWLVLPQGTKPGDKRPMLVYYYEKFSDYFNRFFTPKMYHLPCFPIFTGKGYVIFFPDIKYKVGSPGASATDCVLTGVRKVLSMGFVDSTKIGLQGHSWGGYETAFIITQTNLFAAAAAGAPVGNMTSAYSGIRLGSGLARQFQYERTQSRIGGNLWDSLDSYLRNSPVMQAEKIHTPLLIMFGDKDTAVPWEQGIEIYLAMRRLNKNCVFLEYRGEPHWPTKYPNKLDYAIKMIQFFDHYLLGTPAPDWLTKGKPYRGR